jgi:ketosteroid isomerase-like protein
MSEENVEVVKAVFDAWTSRDPATALGYIDPDIEVDNTRSSFRGEAKTARGAEALQASVASWFETLDSIEFFPKNYIASGDRVIVWFTVSAKGRGSGVPVNARLAAVYTVREGKVSRFETFDSLAEAASAVGI